MTDGQTFITSERNEGMASIKGFELKGRAGVGGMGELFFATRTQSLPGFPAGQPVVLKWVPNTDHRWLAALFHELEVLCHFREVNLARLGALYGVGIAHVQPTGVDAEGKWSYLGEGVVEGDDWEEPEPVQRTFVVLDDIKGTSLKEYIEEKKGRRLGDREASVIALRLSRLLRVLHEDARTLHNDLKPDNVIIGPGADPFRVTLIDYGIAIPLNDDLEAGRQPHELAYWGVQEYMSPEKRRGARDTTGTQLDWRSELWSLGAVTLGMLGRAEVLRRDPATIPASLEGIPPPLQAFLSKALAASPSERYASWDQAEEDLRACSRLLLDAPGAGTHQSFWWNGMAGRIALAAGAGLALLLALAEAISLLG